MGYDTNSTVLADRFAGVTQTTVCETLMKLGYARISKADGSQTLDLQLDALAAADVASDHVYKDEASGKRDDRPGLEACLKALRTGNTLYIWKLDRLGRDLKHLVTTVRSLSERGVGLCVLTGQGADIDTTTSSGKLIFGIFAALAEFEGDLIRERTMAGLAAARARGRKGGRQFELTKTRSAWPNPPWPIATPMLLTYAVNSASAAQPSIDTSDRPANSVITQGGS